MSSNKKWKEEINKAVSDSAWSRWDCEILAAVKEYNHHLSSTPNYILLDWRVIKAMLWIESGANNSDWATKPMQIATLGDSGLNKLLSGKDGGELIMPPLLQKKLTSALATSHGTYNIKAGIGYLLMRMAYFEQKNVIDKDDSRIKELIIEKSDSLHKLAKKYFTTVDTLKQMNANTEILRPGTKLRYRKSAKQKVITGWRQISPTSIAQKYNSNGDPLYKDKLDYALSYVELAKNAESATTETANA